MLPFTQASSLAVKHLVLCVCVFLLFKSLCVVYLYVVYFSYGMFFLYEPEKAKRGSVQKKTQIWFLFWAIFEIHRSSKPRGLKQSQGRTFENENFPETFFKNRFMDTPFCMTAGTNLYCEGVLNMSLLRPDSLLHLL